MKRKTLLQYLRQCLEICIRSLTKERHRNSQDSTRYARVHGRVVPLLQNRLSAFSDRKEQGRFPSPDSIGSSSRLIGIAKIKALCLDCVQTCSWDLESDLLTDHWLTGGFVVKIHSCSV
ncbi:hypothetical protein TNCT_564701 [Trichonephila clavata]|uniref:Uncharacterized protein n=1 Tax=Trichonephila clavata TaxID=2740835 RepID=A0A8X6H6H2_TRICU|nr:hypothetical protein TNCT_564701 [Trichonephila clavata]